MKIRRLQGPREQERHHLRGPLWAARQRHETVALGKRRHRFAHLGDIRGGLVIGGTGVTPAFDEICRIRGAEVNAVFEERDGAITAVRQAPFVVAVVAEKHDHLERIVLGDRLEIFERLRADIEGKHLVEFALEDFDHLQPPRGVELAMNHGGTLRDHAVKVERSDELGPALGRRLRPRKLTPARVCDSWQPRAVVRAITVNRTMRGCAVAKAKSRI